MKKTIIIISALLAALGLDAQNTAAGFLNSSPDAQALAQGGASAAMEATAYSFWNNPAAASLSDRKFAAGVSYGMMQPKLSKADMAAFAGYGRITDRISVQAAAKYYMHKPYDLVSPEGIYDGSFTPKEYSVGAGMSYRIIPCLSAGAGLSYIGSDIGGLKSAGAFSVNLGLFFKMKALTAGLTASNIGTSINYGGEATYSLPMDISLGAAYKLGKPEKSNIDISVQAGMLPLDKSFRAAAGLRYNYAGLFHVSAGYSFAADKDAPSYLTLGAGAEIAGISFDFCYLAGSVIANTLMFNLGYAF